jgi:hypothetical protein
MIAEFSFDSLNELLSRLHDNDNYLFCKFVVIPVIIQFQPLTTLICPGIRKNIPNL